MKFLKTFNPLIPLKAIFNAVKGRVEKTRALTQSDDQFTQSISKYMHEYFNKEAGFFNVTIKPTIFYQQGKPHKGKSVRIEMTSHLDDYGLVQRMAHEAGRKFTLSNKYLVGVYNGTAPIREKRLEADAQEAAAAASATAKAQEAVTPVPVVANSAVKALSEATDAMPLPHVEPSSDVTPVKPAPAQQQDPQMPAAPHRAKNMAPQPGL